MLCQLKDLLRDPCGGYMVKCNIDGKKYLDACRKHSIIFARMLLLRRRIKWIINYISIISIL